MPVHLYESVRKSMYVHVKKHRCAGIYILISMIENTLTFIITNQKSNNIHSNDIIDFFQRFKVICIYV